MLSVLLALLLLWIVTAVHEAGHALGVHLKGGQVEAVEVGRGPALRRVSSGGTHLALGLFPVGGKLVYRGVPMGTGHAVVALAGPTANLLLAFLLLQSAVRVGEWLWIVPGSVVEILSDGRAVGLLEGIRIIGQDLGSGTVAGPACALGALSAVWAGLNLLPIPGIGSDGWAIVRNLAAVIRVERGSRAPTNGPTETGRPGTGSSQKTTAGPDGPSGTDERREVS